MVVEATFQCEADASSMVTGRCTSTLTSLASIRDGVMGFTMLEGARAVTTFEHGAGLFAIVASHKYGPKRRDGVQLIDLSTPGAPLAAGAAIDDVTPGFTALGGACGVATFRSATSTYAVVLV